MTSITERKTGSKSIQLVLADGRRKTIGLGKVSKRAAELIRFQVELLLHAQRTGTAIPRQTAEWSSGISKKLRSRLVDLNLLPPLAATRSESHDLLGVSLDDTIETWLQSAVKDPNTKRLTLRACIGAQCDRMSISCAVRGQSQVVTQQSPFRGEAF